MKFYKAVLDMVSATKCCILLIMSMFMLMLAPIFKELESKNLGCLLVILSSVVLTVGMFVLVGRVEAAMKARLEKKKKAESMADRLL